MQGLFLDSRFYSIDLYVYIYANITFSSSTVVLWQILRLGSESPPTLFYFPNIGLSVLDPLKFHTNFRTNLPISAKEKKIPGRVYMRIVLNLWIDLETIAVLTI